jgi:alkyl sulfatase BDS1-like metallo-beta-lactamase superfamily hydrolase
LHVISANSNATEQTRRNILTGAERLPMADTQDFADAERGSIGRSALRQILGSDGHVVWDLDAYRFLDAPVPDTATPSLWRQSQLCAKDGLFEVRPGIYQVRGFDLSNVSFIEGIAGVIVVDPLTVRETAAAAFELYTSHRGRRPVAAVIYSHSHIDHFGGVKGIVSEQDVISAGIPVIAPAGFMEHAVAENIFTGTAMARRAGYMYGAALRRGPDAQIGAGLGQTVPRGETTLIAPTLEITHTGQELTIDGVRLQFQVTPGTEAPAEMNFYFPDLRALCTAENTSHTLHNILTIRGAVVRDAHAWAHYLSETIGLWGDKLDVVFASHHWPTWDQERAVEFLSLQRDLYLYLHDQTLRLINQGYVGEEIAEQLQLPPALEAAWHAHGYYGSISHNVKAIYQRYLGWYDGNPAHLWKHPPVEAARRYVAAMGGTAAAVQQARRAYREGDYRWVVELLNHVLFADEAQADARELQANAFEQLGFGAENGTWRNAFLAGAEELRRGAFGTPTAASDDVIGALTVPQVFSGIAIRVDGPRAWSESLSICWVITDDGATYLTELRNGVFSHRAVANPAAGITVFTLSRKALIGLVTGSLDPAQVIASGTVTVSGDASVVARLVGLLAPVDSNFAIVTP